MYLVFEVFRDTWHPNKENPSVYLVLSLADFCFLVWPSVSLFFNLYYLLIGGAGTCNFEFEHMCCTEDTNKQEARKRRLASLLTNYFGSQVL